MGLAEPVTPRARCRPSCQVEGLFSEATWIRVLGSVGFEVRTVGRGLEAREILPYTDQSFLATRPG